MEWDRSHDWELHRYFNDLTRVTIRFKCARPSLAELAAIRRRIPQYRDMNPAAARASIGESGQLSLGVLPTREARQIIEAVQGEGLAVVAEGASYISYLPYDNTTGCALLIEDEEQAEAVVQSMLDAGVPVRVVEA